MIYKHKLAVPREYSAKPARNSKPIFIKNVACSGTELTLMDCSYDSDTSEDDHSKDVGVQCQQRKFYS